MNSFGFKLTSSREVKKFDRAFTTSIYYLKVLINVVSRLNRASIFFKRSSLIPKRFWNYSEANNYNKSVQIVFSKTFKLHN